MKGVPIVILLCFSAKASAFLSWSTVPIRPSRSLICARQGGDSDWNDGRFFDLEAERRRLEAMMGLNTVGADDAVTSSVTERPILSIPPPPIMTTIAKERRMAEIQYLSQLADSDDALTDLWSLWFAERGPEAAVELLRAEELAGKGPRRWNEAEVCLRNLIQKHSVHWVEPVNRLATLLYTQGRLTESKELCETVLKIKPWHFGALSGIVMVCAGLGDTASARQWASRRLPPMQPIGPNERRIQWVQRSVEDAHLSLIRAEEHVRASFGAPDRHLIKKKEKNNKNEIQNPKFDESDDAWQ